MTCINCVLYIYDNSHRRVKDSCKTAQSMISSKHYNRLGTFTKQIEQKNIQSGLFNYTRVYFR